MMGRFKLPCGESSRRKATSKNTALNWGLCQKITLPFARPVEGGDTAEIIRSAGLVGRWFTKADQPATIFALLGVAP